MVSQGMGLFWQHISFRSSWEHWCWKVGPSQQEVFPISEKSVVQRSGEVKEEKKKKKIEKEEATLILTGTSHCQDCRSWNTVLPGQVQSTELQGCQPSSSSPPTVQVLKAHSPEDTIQGEFPPVLFFPSLGSVQNLHRLLRAAEPRLLTKVERTAI